MVEFGRWPRRGSVGQLALKAKKATNVRSLCIAMERCSGVIRRLILLEPGIEDGQGSLKVANMPCAVAIFDLEMRYMACSPSWLKDQGLEEQDVIGKSCYAYVPEGGDHWREIHQRVLAGETISSDCDKYARYDGTFGWVQWYMYPWQHRDGSIGGVVNFARMRTDEIESRLESWALCQGFEMLLEGAKHYAFLMLDPSGINITWQQGGGRLLGRNDPQISPNHFSSLFLQSDRNRGFPEKLLDDAMKNGAHNGQYFIACPNNNPIFVKMNISPVHLDKIHIGFGVLLQDMTEEICRTAEAEAREAQLRAILNTVPDAMVVINEEGIIQSFSSTAEIMFGYSRDEAIGQSVELLMTTPDKLRHANHISEYRKTAKSRIIGKTQRVHGLRKDGSIFPLELTVGEAFGGGRRVFTGFLRDLTEREEAEHKLRQLQLELLRISRVSAVGTMATALAHELNQPLTAIANYVQTSATLLAQLPDDMMHIVRHALEEAGREAVRAGAIIHHLRMFVSRGELDHSIVSPAELVKETLLFAGISGRGGKLTCDVDLPAELDDIVVDRVQIQQVLLNLIRNAMEALSGPGRIRIGCAAVAGGMVQFSIEDDGPGVPPDRESGLFEPFVSSKESGMGIGLAICKTIVESHGGRMWYQRCEGGGAGFYFTVQTVQGAIEHE